MRRRKRRDDMERIPEELGIPYLRPYQELVITHILECRRKGRGARVLCSLPTGSGKSLCFILPIMMIRKRTVLIYPLLSLMDDQARRFRKANIPHVILSGGLAADERRKRLGMIASSPYISVITNPEMLSAMMESGTLSILRSPSLLVIDEVHAAVTWGDSFRPAYRKMDEIIRALNPRSILAFTATMDRNTERGIIERIFRGRLPYIVRASPDRENIFYHAKNCLCKEMEIISVLAPSASRPAVVFCPSRKSAEATAERLSHRFPAKCYHAGMDREEKVKAGKWFMESSNGVLAATSAYGMGVSKDDIRTVIHSYLPQDALEYMQESGRAGRDGARADVYVFFYGSEKSPLRDIFTGSECIRASLLSAMDIETEERRCLGCSACIPSPCSRAGENIILRFFLLHPLTTISAAAAALSSPHFLLRRWRLPEWREDEVRRAVRILAGEGKLKMIGKRIICPIHHCRRS